ncbi:MAG: DNA cytosine methyltransferase [Lachnospiraceae bacterium]|nr:DNA cytosine methyltransferase [Lachnospiraceae bacterium]
MQEGGDVCPTLTATESEICRIEKAEVINPLKGLSDNGWHFEQNVYDSNGLVRAVKAGGGSGNIPKVIEKVGQISNEGSQCGTVVSDDGLSPNLVAGTHGYANHHVLTRYRIRKLTPLECWKLMDFSDQDFHKAEAVNSNTQLYKQAGNSIVRNVLVAIFGQMLPGKEDEYKKGV